MTANLLFVCGSLNQTTMMHKIAQSLPEFNNFFSPFYAEGMLAKMVPTGALDHTILAGSHYAATENYLKNNRLSVDLGGRKHQYDLAITGTDLIVQSNLRKNRLILIQEGITEPEDTAYHVVKNLGLPRFLANTAATGLSDAYDRFFVASQGYKELFIRKGVKPEKVVVTGIPNFDNAAEALQNDFPYRGYVLVATSSIRETGKLDNRMAFLRKVRHLAGGRRVIFRLHPNENKRRAEHEIRSILPEALIFREGNTNHMIANCSVLITQVSSVVFTGIALGKDVYSNYELQSLYQLAPIQNGGTSAARIADECRAVMQLSLQELRRSQPVRRQPLVPNWQPLGFE
jgi:hypothetical protein